MSNQEQTISDPAQMPIPPDGTNPYKPTYQAWYIGYAGANPEPVLVERATGVFPSDENAWHICGRGARSMVGGSFGRELFLTWEHARQESLQLLQRDIDKHLRDMAHLQSRQHDLERLTEPAVDTYYQ